MTNYHVSKQGKLKKNGLSKQFATVNVNVGELSTVDVKLNKVYSKP
jgi:hypothetical protein